MGRKFVKDRENDHKNELSMNNQNGINLGNLTKEMMMEVVKKRRKRANDDPLYTLTARAYDLGKFRKFFSLYFRKIHRKVSKKKHD